MEVEQQGGFDEGRWKYSNAGAEIMQLRVDSDRFAQVFNRRLAEQR